MSLEKNLMKLERYCSKAWRVHAKEDLLYGLSFNEYDYLRSIEEHQQGIRITDLAEEMKVTKPSASNMVARLERKGLVKRISCAEDGRAKRVVLTEQVLEDLSYEQVVYQHIAEQMGRKLSADEVNTLIGLLEKSLS